MLLHTFSVEKQKFSWISLKNLGLQLCFYKEQHTAETALFFWCFCIISQNVIPCLKTLGKHVFLEHFWVKNVVLQLCFRKCWISIENVVYLNVFENLWKQCKSVVFMKSVGLMEIRWNPLNGLASVQLISISLTDGNPLNWWKSVELMGIMISIGSLVNP